MAKKPVFKAPPDKLALYEKVLEAFPEVELKGAANAYTAFNGNMFSFLLEDGRLALRFDEGELDEILAKYKAEPCRMYGRMMRGYAVLPDAQLKKVRSTTKLFERSFAYVKTLKAKPTTKKKAVAKKPPVKKALIQKPKVKKKAVAKPVAAKPVAVKMAAAKKSAAKVAPAKKAATKKAPAKKAAPKKAAPKKAAAKKKTAKKAPVRR
tara:strand:- start:7166 stop:7789 length:624 start_codon:yes stop_codon:yes gene_type:complete